MRGGGGDVGQPRVRVVWDGTGDLGAAGLEFAAPCTAQRLRQLLTAEARRLGADAVLESADGAQPPRRAARAPSSADATVLVTGAPPVELTHAGAEPPAAVAVLEPIGSVPADQLTAGLPSEPTVLRARGVDAAVNALRHVLATAAEPPSTHRYGEHPDQVADLRLPADAGPHPVAVLLHGGFWYPAWQRDQTDRLAVDLTRRGWASWNVEYRRIGTGGRWPAAADDVAAGVAHLHRLGDDHPLDLDRIVLIGHSAGGHLAVLTAAALTGGGGERSTSSAPRPRAAVAMAAVLDLSWAADDPVGRDAVARFAPDDPRARRRADPLHRVPIGVPLVVAQARDDRIVPVEQADRFVTAARSAGDEVQTLLPAEGGHFCWLEPTSSAWQAVVEMLQRSGAAP